MIGTILAQIYGRRSTASRPPTRLRENEVLAIAATVIRRSNLGILKVGWDDGQIVWTAGTQNIGANEWVRIADDGGEVLGHHQGGLR